MSAVPIPRPVFDAMTEADLDSVMPVEKEIYPFPWTPGNFRDSLRAGYFCRVYRIGGQLIGYAVLMQVAGEAHLLNLSVAAPEQRRGHGRALLDHMIALARDKGARTLFLEVRPSNMAAQRLYSRYGFRQVGVRRGYYPATVGREDAVVQVLDL